MLLVRWINRLLCNPRNLEEICAVLLQLITISHSLSSLHSTFSSPQRPCKYIEFLLENQRNLLKLERWQLPSEKRVLAITVTHQMLTCIIISFQKGQEEIS